MNHPQRDFSLGVRIAHLVSAVFLLLLIATGARLIWFDLFSLPGQLVEFIDKIAPTGRVHLWHIYFGAAFIATGIFYLANMLFSGEWRRLLKLTTDQAYTPKRRICYLTAIAVGLVSALTGLGMYMGWYVGSGHAFARQVHYLCLIYWLLFLVVHFVETLASSRARFGSIFLSKPGPRFVRGWVLTLSVAITLACSLVLLPEARRPATLVCRKQSHPIVLDGKESYGEWTGAEVISLSTGGGTNFDGSVSEVTIKAIHDIQQIYFLVKWTDQQRSYNRFLEKTNGGWVERVTDRPGRFGECVYFEDQLALSFHAAGKGCMQTCHLRTPVKTGLHYTEGDTADIWVWRAVSTNAARQADDGWWSVYEDAKTGGRHFDNAAGGGYFSNLNREWQQPYFLPLHHSMRCWIPLESNAVTPYFSEIDDFPVGSQVPAVLVSPFMGDRGDVRARGQWHNGEWTVEFARRLKTGSPADIVFRGEVYFCVAPFNNAEQKHAYHLKPIRLVIE